MTKKTFPENWFPFNHNFRIVESHLYFQGGETESITNSGLLPLNTETCFQAYSQLNPCDKVEFVKKKKRRKKRVELSLEQWMSTFHYPG